ncbi:MAG: putative rane-bound dehydrogenase [Verrucomicrobiales bacterium]|nr:putative rane-bound dehydrogenase [Verrucomicrobiales bacterium]
MKSILTWFCALGAALTLHAADSDSGVLPKDSGGRTLNFDFEDGTLRDWKATGNAFEKQPVRGDTVSRRRGDMKSSHHGDYWIGTYEVSGDDVQGTLTSVPFKVAAPYCSFLVAGGSASATRVELVREDSQEPFFKVSGTESETLRPVVVDLKAQQGKSIFIRIVDQAVGGWSHINFDNFRFHDSKPNFSDVLDPQKIASEIPPADTVKFAGLSPEDAAKEASLPPGFSMKLFAGEPDIRQPIAFALDARGRIWVAEAYTYPRRAPEGQGKDRILIFEDTNGDGKFDKRTVFIEHLNLVSGLAVGFGGVWVGASPQFLFIPDRNHDDVPDGPPEVVFDGWAYQDTHETLNTFTWGPDGWLYGCHGVFTQSNVGKPGAPDSERTRLNAGVWRFQPQTRKFELFAEGTSNPWGIDFDKYGQCQIEACVIPHFFHMIQGGRFERQAGQHFNPNVYDDIKTIADHLHYAGSKGPHAGNGRSDAAGGGHAHAGMLIYQGDSWPAEYQGKAFMNNIHGQRLNMDILEHKGSGFVAHHGKDFVNFNDSWSQILNMLSDQDGSVYMIDWYDKNQCHHNNVEGHDRTNGRIFKLVYNDHPGTQVDLEKLSSEELVKLALHPNEWHVRNARRILQERGPNPGLHRMISDLISKQSDDAKRLRLLWTLHAIGGLTQEKGLSLLDDKSEYVRAWTIQLLAEGKDLSDPLLKKFAKLAKSDPSPVVRLYLASAMQRTPVERRWEVVTALLNHGEDSGDHNLPLMYWYAAEPCVASNVARGSQLLAHSKIPLVREYIARRMVVASRSLAGK